MNHHSTNSNSIEPSQLESHRDESQPSFALDIDIDQWRSDVRTFAETTGRVLDAIASELSSTCANERLDGEADGQDIARFFQSSGSAKDSLPDVHSPDRLSRLRAKLEERLSSTNDEEGAV